MNPHGPCPQCGHELSPTAPLGLCSQCLLQSILELAPPDDDSPPGAGQSQPEPGRRFGDYELLEVIARGGMGVVYRARQLGLDRIVALKRVRAGEFASDAERKRFRAEAEAVAHLDHPNIVPIHEVGEAEGEDYFVMKLIEGGSLARRMTGVVSPGRAGNHSPDLRSDLRHSTAILSKVAQAVHHAHQRGVLHRDLKPANILLDARDEPFVTDFGLAKRMETGLDLTLSGAVVGTPNYMSPEQAAGRSHEITTAADVYSLGAILYEFIAGRPPFQADTPLETMRRVLEEEPVPPSRAWKRVAAEPSSVGRGGIRAGRDPARSPEGGPASDRDLETICLKCLQKNPARRYASAGALADDLDRWLRHEPIHARPSTPRERAIKWTRRHPARAALLAVSVTAVLGFVSLILVNRQELQGERNHALQQEQKANAAAAQAEAGELAARERAYAADIYAASQALAADDLALSRRLLGEHRPGEPTTGRDLLSSGSKALLSARPPATDLRGFEWRALWELTRGQEAFAFTNLSHPADCLLFTPDGRTLISGGYDGVHLWDVGNHRPIGLFPGPDPGPTPGDRAPTRDELRPMLEASPAVVEHLRARPAILDYLDSRGHTNRTRRVKSLAVTPDGKHLLVGSQDFVRSWNLATHAFDFAIPEQRATISMPARGDLFVVANNETLDPTDDTPSAHPQSALVYNFGRRRMVAELPGYGWLGFISPDGQSVVAASRSQGVVLWRPSTGETLPISLEFGSTGELSLSPDGHTLFLRPDNRRQPMILDVPSGRIMAYLRSDRVETLKVAWSPDGRTLAAGGGRSTIGLWSIPSAGIAKSPGTGPPVLEPQTVLRGHNAMVTALAFSPDGRWLGSAANDRSIRLWDLGEVLGDLIPDRLEFDGWSAPMVDPESGCVFGRSGGVMKVWDPRTAQSPRSLPGTRNVYPAGFLSQGRGLVTVDLGTNNVPIRLEIRHLPEGTVQTTREIPPVPPEFASIGIGAFSNFTLAASPDGRWLAVPQTGVDRSGSLHVFAADTGRFMACLSTPPSGALRGLLASPDSRWLVRLDHSTGYSLISVYDTRNWRLAREISFPSVGFEVVSSSIDPTSRLIATGGPTDNSLRVWDLITGRLVGQCNGTDKGWHPVWSRDGRILVVRDRNSLRFWSMKVFRELAAFPVAGRDPHFPLCFTPDDRVLVAYTLDHGVRIWSPPTLAEIDAQP